MEKEIQFEDHFINRSNWIRASVLGANDGILSVASIAVSVAANRFVSSYDQPCAINEPTNEK